MSAQIVYDGVLEPDDATDFVRGIPAEDSLQFLNAFPSIPTDTNSIDWGEITRLNRTAEFRSFDGRIHVSKRDLGSQRSVNLLPLSTSLSMGELERLQLEYARNRGGNDARLAEAAYDDAEQLTREIQARLELAWGDLLEDGVLTISEGGYAGEADFGVPPDHKVAPASAPWSNVETSTPLSNIEAWNDKFAATNGVGAARIKTSLRTRRNVLRSKQVIAAVHGSTAGRTRVTLSELEELLAGEGLPIFDVPYDTSVVVGDTEQRVLAENKVLLLPENLRELGGTALGVSATALELVNSGRVDLDFENAPGIVGVVLSDGPPFRQYVFVDAVAMPVLTNARKVVIATV